MSDPTEIDLRKRFALSGTGLHRRVHALITGPKIVVLCGSTRFKDEYEEQNRLLTAAGHIVLSVGWFGHSGDTPVGTDDLTPEFKQHLDDLHKRKIDLAEEVVVICPGGYVGASTQDEIAYALRQGKTIIYPYGYRS